MAKGYKYYVWITGLKKDYERHYVTNYNDSKIIVLTNNKDLRCYMNWEKGFECCRIVRKMFPDNEVHIRCIRKEKTNGKGNTD